MQWSWLKRRWFEFRAGHNTYLAFILSFTNFLLITYNFLIGKIPFLSDVFSNLWVFAILLVVIYIPMAVVVGRVHNKKQLSVDNEVTARANPLTMEIIERLERIEKRMEAK
jgi:hypothetical protein